MYYHGEQQRLVTFALEETVNSIEHGRLGLIEQTHNQPLDFGSLVPNDIAAELNMQRKVVSFDVSWAKRPPHGHAYGKMYVQEYISDIERFVNNGIQDKSKRMGPGRIRSILANLHPPDFTFLARPRLSL